MGCFLSWDILVWFQKEMNEALISQLLVCPCPSALVTPNP